MPKFEEIAKQIEVLRAKLLEIKDGKDLTDPEVVTASQMLDAVLNEYYKMLKHKVN
jgi:hypothetical protein